MHASIISTEEKEPKNPIEFPVRETSKNRLKIK